MSEFVLESPGDELLADWPDWLPQYFSPSQIKLARACMEQYRLRYVKGIKTPPAAALVWGTADHKAQELNFAQKIESHEDLPVDAVMDRFRDAVEEGIAAEGGLDEILWPEGKDARSGKVEMIDDGTRLAALYHQELAPTVQPVAVEEWFEYQIPGFSSLQVRGQLDVRQAGAILDTKTTSSSKQKVTNENLLQGRIYSVAWGLPVEFHLKVKPRSSGGKISVVAGEPVLPSDANQQVTLTAVKRTLGQIAFAAKTYGPDEPWPDALAHEWRCSWCGFRDQGLCFYWGGAARG